MDTVKWEMIFLYILLCFGTRNTVSKPLNIKEKQLIDEYMDRILSCRKVPGGSVAIVRDGQLLFAKGYGYADYHKAIRTTTSTKFCLASVTKAFTSTLIAMLITGKNAQATGATYDTPVRKILGDWVNFGDSVRTTQASLKDLLSHKMGLPRYDQTWLLGDEPLEALLQKIRFFKSTSAFRTLFTYSNIMYALAGKVAEKWGENTWENLIQNMIFRPIGMTNTGFLDKDAPWLDYAIPNFLFNNTITAMSQSDLRGVGTVGAAGSICSTPFDIAKWMNFLLSGGVNDRGKRLVNGTLLSYTMQPQSVLGDTPKNVFHKPYAPYTDSRDTYSMGWMNGFYKGYRIYTHDGSLVGYYSSIILIPHKKIGIWLGTNGPNYYALRLIPLFIADIIMGQKPWLNASTVCTFPEPFAQPPTNGVNMTALQMNPQNQYGQAARSFRDYEGVYGNYIFGNITIYIEGDHLKMTYGRFKGFRLIPSKVPDSFMSARGQLKWPTSFGHVVFSATSDPTYIDTVTLPGLERQDPPSFKLDLKQADAPPPTNFDVCGGHSNTSPLSETHNSLLILLGILIVKFASYH